jgi:hypothetical protein
MDMDLKTLYLLILGITITILTHTIFKTPAPIKEGFFDAIIKLVRDIQNIICFIRWFINFMRWVIESLICIFKYINPLCVFFAVLDIIIAAIAWLIGKVLEAMGLEWVNVGFRFGLDGIDSIAEKLSGSRLFRYPDVLNKMCYSCVLKPPPSPPKPF